MQTKEVNKRAWAMGAAHSVRGETATSEDLEAMADYLLSDEHPGVAEVRDNDGLPIAIVIRRGVRAMKCEKCGSYEGWAFWTSGHPVNLCSLCARAWHMRIIGTDLDLEYETVLQVLARYRSGGELRGVVDAGVKVAEKARLMGLMLTVLTDWLGEDNSNGG